MINYCQVLVMTMLRFLLFFIFYEMFHSRLDLNSSAALVNSQIARLLPVGIFNLVMFNLEFVSNV